MYALFKFRSFLYLLRALGGASDVKVALVLLDGTNEEDPVFYGTIRRIAELAKISKSSADRVMRSFCDTGIVTKVSAGIWIMHKDVLVKKINDVGGRPQITEEFYADGETWRQ